MRLSGKRILITGGGSGIGLALAQRLAPANRVVIAGRDQAKLEQARAGTELLARRLDVTSEESAAAAIRWVSDELGGLDLLVNNAGLVRGYGIDSDQSVEDVEVNLGGPIRMTRLALPLLQAGDEGAVLFVSSAVALGAVPGMAVYAATKAAVHSLARSLRTELAPIRVFEVLPPTVDTGAVGELDVPKASPASVADAILEGLARDREEILIGRIRQLALVARIAPRLADRLILGALTPRATRGTRG
jgi:uncharacterized oxidoreductase